MFKPLAAAAVAVGFAVAPLVATAQDVDYDAEIQALVGDADLEQLAKDGAKVYRKCRACHEVAKERNKVGPHQVGVIGRPAGAVDGFNYSDAMAESGLVWDVATLQEYLKDPKGFLKGTKMAFAGLRKDEDLTAVIYYLYAEGGVYQGTN